MFDLPVMHPVARLMTGAARRNLRDGTPSSRQRWLAISNCGQLGRYRVNKINRAVKLGGIRMGKTKRYSLWRQIFGIFPGYLLGRNEK